MKILYLTRDNDAGEHAARALHGVAQNVTLTTAATPDSALRWLERNPDTTVVVAAPHADDGPVVIDQLLPRIVSYAIERDRSRRHGLARALSEAEAAASARLADVQARHAASLVREARICKGLQQTLFELEAALRAAEERRTSEAGAFADQLARRHAEFTASLTHTLQARDAVASELADATVALAAAEEARRRDVAAATEQLRRREAELGAALSDARVERAILERALTEMEVAHRDTLLLAHADLGAARERQAALEELLTQETDRRTALEQRFAGVEAALEDTAHRYAREQTQAEAALSAASMREAELASRLQTESASRIALERELADLRQESSRRIRRLLFVASAHRERSRQQRAAYEEQLTALGADAAVERQEKDALRLQLALAQTESSRLQNVLEDERQAHERARLASASELQRVLAEHGQLKQSFDQLQSAFQMLDEIAGEHAAERARLEAAVGERDSELHAQAARHRAAAQAAQDAFAESEEGLRRALAERESELARIERERDGLRRELEATRTRADVLRREADRVPDLEAQLESNQKERRREFERAPYGLCRCTPDGVITDVNHVFAAMLGRRRVDDVRNTKFASAVFDCAGDLGWLLERTNTTRASEPIETAWKSRDGRDLFVRLHASATAMGSVEIVVEDITRVRSLEERLRRAQRMEAVARLASEVSVTCNGLLADVARGVREWVGPGASAETLRHGDRLLTDLTRASSFLRQLSVYGDQQSRALASVSVQRVLTDLAPVLKRVVGDHVSLVLAKSSGSFEVDVELERLERVLVNVASYARERMPRGGQMRIEVAATALGRRFVSRYPNVRPGHHVLITVTELPRMGEMRDSAATADRSPDRPGVDLGALAELMGTCGGHLWLEAQPAGNLVVKIYLPRRAAAVDVIEPSVSADRSERSGRLARWFRAAPATRLRA
jgi:hypothetical protein